MVIRWDHWIKRSLACCVILLKQMLCHIKINRFKNKVLNSRGSLALSTYGTFWPSLSLKKYRHMIPPAHKAYQKWIFHFKIWLSANWRSRLTKNEPYTKQNFTPQNRIKLNSVFRPYWSHGFNCGTNLQIWTSTAYSFVLHNGYLLGLCLLFTASKTFLVHNVWHFCGCVLSTRLYIIRIRLVGWSTMWTVKWT